MSWTSSQTTCRAAVLSSVCDYSGNFSDVPVLVRPLTPLLPHCPGSLARCRCPSPTWNKWGLFWNLWFFSEARLPLERSASSGGRCWNGYHPIQRFSTGGSWPESGSRGWFWLALGLIACHYFFILILKYVCQKCGHTFIFSILTTFSTADIKWRHQISDQYMYIIVAKEKNSPKSAPQCYAIYCYILLYFVYAGWLF